MLIEQMARENPLWGAERIRGELLNLEIRVSKRTIQKYMRAVRSELHFGSHVYALPSATTPPTNTPAAYAPHTRLAQLASARIVLSSAWLTQGATLLFLSTGLLWPQLAVDDPIHLCAQSLCCSFGIDILLYNGARQAGDYRTLIDPREE